MMLKLVEDLSNLLEREQLRNVLTYLSLCAYLSNVKMGVFIVISNGRRRSYFQGEECRSTDCESDPPGVGPVTFGSQVHASVAIRFQVPSFGTSDAATRDS